MGAVVGVHMTTWFISRHPGAVGWARRHGIAFDRLVSHLDPAGLRSGDTVIGTLPVNLAAAACERGAAYLHLSVDLPASERGRELDADELERFGAKLERFEISRLSTPREGKPEP